MDTSRQSQQHQEQLKAQSQTLPSQTGQRIAIAGAGIAGLCTALALQQRGFEVDVYEQAGQLGDLGAGLQLSPNGTRVLQALGLEKALAPLVCEAARKEVRHFSTGQRWKLFDLGSDCRERFGAPYWMVHRGDLHGVLLQALNAAAPKALRLQSRVVKAQTQPGGVQLTLADGSQHTAAALLACDGVHSQLRGAWPDEVAPHFTGLLAWRGLVPMGALPERLQVNALEAVGTNWVGPGAHVITYPVRGAQLMNVVGIVERSDWQAESWTQAGDTAELQRDFSSWHADVRCLMAAIEHPFKWALLGRKPRAAWAHGRICLLGDAAHPTLPFLAQGANMAIEDAWVMADVLASDLDVESALRRFEDLRWQRCADIVQRSSDNASRFHNPQLADPDFAQAYIRSEWDSEKVRHRYDWLFSYDALSAAKGKLPV